MKKVKFEIDPDDLYHFRVKRYARLAVHWAIEDGEIVRPDSCEMCCCIHDMIQAHHTNYGDPLNVNWLCPNCHYQVHADKKHPLNPVNCEQSIRPSIQKNLTYATLSVKLPIENYLIIKDRAERYGTTVEEQITRSLVHAWPVRVDARSNDDDAREQHLERISSVVENETELPSRELSGLQEPWSEGRYFRSTMDRFYSLCSRHGGNAN